MADCAQGVAEHVGKRLSEAYYCNVCLSAPLACKLGA